MQLISARVANRAHTALAETLRDQHADTEKLTALQAQLAAEQQRIRESGDASEYSPTAQRIDRERVDIQARMRSREDEIRALQDHLADRAAEQRAKAYRNAVEKISGRILALNGAVSEFADAMAAVMQKLEQLGTAQRSALRDWPSELERPLLSHIGLGRAEQTLAEGFKVFDRNVFSRWPDWSLERRIAHVRSTAADFKEDEIKAYEEMIAELRAGGPKENEEAAA
jgi:hypothetical protein